MFLHLLEQVFVSRSIIPVSHKISYFQSLEEATDPLYKPYLAIHKAIREKNMHVFDELKTSKMFNISMVGVDPTYRGKGVATDLIRR